MKFLLALALAVAPLTSQIRVTTRLVEVNVIVRDRNGAVRGLTKDDFELYDRGKRRDIAFFSENSSAPKPPTPLPPNVSSNLPEHRGIDRAGVTIVLFDGVNTPAADQIWAKRQFLAFLAQAQPQDRIAVYSLGRNLRVLTDFTTDPKRLAAVVAPYRGRVDFALDAPLERVTSDDPASDEQWNEFLQKFEDEQLDRRIQHTADAVEAIARQIGAIPGRKNLIWMSAGFPFENQDPRFPKLYGEAAERMARALSAVNFALYPVDARGLVAMPSMAADGRFAAPRRPGLLTPTSPLASGGRGPVSGPVRAEGMTPSGQAVMNLLAQATGGRAFTDTNDIRGAIRTVLDESASTYTLAFRPEEADLDSKSHKLTVKVNRPGVESRHRDSYLAVADPPRDDGNRAAEIRSAIVSPLDTGGIGLRVRATRGAELRLDVLITAQDVTFEHTGEHWNASMQAILAQRAADGRDLGTTFYTVGPDFDDTHYKDALAKGVGFSKSIAAAPDAVDVKVIVVDRASGRIGSLVVPLR
jgi:VWFA-related protein